MPWIFAFTSLLISEIFSLVKGWLDPAKLTATTIFLGMTPETQAAIPSFVAICTCTPSNQSTNLESLVAARKVAIKDYDTSHLRWLASGFCRYCSHRYPQLSPQKNLIW